MNPATDNKLLTERIVPLLCEQIEDAILPFVSEFCDAVASGNGTAELLRDQSLAGRLRSEFLNRCPPVF